MILLWTKSHSPLSWVIRKITGEDCSHFAFVFEGPGRSGLMFESNLLGTHPAFYKTSLKNHKVIHSKEFPLDIKDEDKVWDIVVEKYDGKSYDLLGALYLGLRILMKRLVRAPLPEKNSWAKQDKFFCDELYEVFNESPGFPKIYVSNGMDTPHGVWEKICQNASH